MRVYVGKTKEYTSFTLLQKAFFVESGKRIQENQIERNEYGKPYFSNRELPCFNISHSGDYIACALSESEIGIDIQKIRGIPDGVIERYLHCDRIDNIRQIIEWTKFESFGKMRGTGIPPKEDYKIGSFLSALELTGYVLTVCAERESDQALELVFI